MVDALFASTTARAAASLDQAVTQAEGVTSRLAQDLWQVVSADINRWLSQHAVFSWLLSHPLVTLGLAFVAIVLLWSFVQAAVQLTQRGWALCLRLPLYLLRLGWRGTLYVIRWGVDSLRHRYQQRQGPAPVSGGPTANSEPLAGDAVDPGARGLADHAPPAIDAERPAAKHSPQFDNHAEILQTLKRLEALGQAQTKTLQHLISLIEAPAEPPPAAAPQHAPPVQATAAPLLSQRHQGN